MNQRWINCKENYKERINIMYNLINFKGVHIIYNILDIGCGQEYLKSLLPNNLKYIGLDIIKRSDNTIVADINNIKNAQLKYYDYVFCSGVLEYIDNLENFLKEIRYHGVWFIFSYASNNTSIEERIKSDWVNHYTKEEFEKLLEKLNFQILNKKNWKNQDIYLLT